MQVCVTQGGKKLLEGANQGYYTAVLDIEEHIMGKEKDGRVHEEMYGRILCQANNYDSQWGSAGRYVWAISSDETKALLIGYVPQHQGTTHAENEYRELKEKAIQLQKDKNAFNEALKNATVLVSKDILKEQAKKWVNETKEKPPTRLQEWNNAYLTTKPEELSLLEQLIGEAMQQKHLSNREIKIIKRLAKDNPFRKMVLKLADKDNQENGADKEGAKETSVNEEQKGQTANTEKPKSSITQTLAACQMQNPATSPRRAIETPAHGSQPKGNAPQNNAAVISKIVEEKDR